VPGYAHPTTNWNLLNEFNLAELVNSDNLQSAVDLGYITLRDQYGNPITSVFAQLVTSLEIRDNGVPVADFVSALDFHGALISTGPQGLKAEIAGFQGPTGAGFQGPIGIQGSPGVQGVVGATGPQGTNATYVDSFLLNGTFNGTSNTSRYLNGPDGVSLEVAPLVLPYAVQLAAISATSEQGAATANWTAEVWVNGALLTGATLDMNGVDKNHSASYGTVANLSAGDEVALYVNRTSGGVRKPRINAFFTRV
jgi:hypothetical protein